MSSEAPVRRLEDWQQLISEHKQAGLAVKAFCQKHGVSEALFYSWRKRVVAEHQPARFALVATNGVAPSAPALPPLQLVLAGGSAAASQARAHRARSCRQGKALCPVCA